jgi:anti-anti-sigma factor
MGAATTQSVRTGKPLENVPTLDLVCLPGKSGPILRCFGELSVGTVAALRWELERLELLGQRTVVVDLAGCDFLDTEGALTLLDSFKRHRERDCQLVLVGTGQPAWLLRVTGIDAILPVFPSEAAAVGALRGGGENDAEGDRDGWRSGQASLALDGCAPQAIGAGRQCTRDGIYPGMAPSSRVH